MLAHFNTDFFQPADPSHGKSLRGAIVKPAVAVLRVKAWTAMSAAQQKRIVAGVAFVPGVAGFFPLSYPAHKSLKGLVYPANHIFKGRRIYLGQLRECYSKML